MLNSSIDITMSFLFNTDLMSVMTEIKDDDMVNDDSEICVDR